MTERAICSNPQFCPFYLKEILLPILRICLLYISNLFFLKLCKYILKYFQFMFFAFKAMFYQIPKRIVTMVTGQVRGISTKASSQVQGGQRGRSEEAIKALQCTPTPKCSLIAKCASKMHSPLSAKSSKSAPYT